MEKKKEICGKSQVAPVKDEIREYFEREIICWAVEQWKKIAFS